MYRRYLPTLTLKKQQLQSEIRTVEAKAIAVRQAKAALEEGFHDWIAVFSEKDAFPGGIITVSNIRKGYGNIAHYTAAKHGVNGLMKTLAQELAPHRIRVNTVNPTQVDTPMIMNDAMYELFCPDIDEPTREDFAPLSQAMNALPIPWVESVDVSNAVLFLASDEARYITGVALPVDAGVLVK